MMFVTPAFGQSAAPGRTKLILPFRPGYVAFASGTPLIRANDNDAPMIRTALLLPS
jgi:hypothetical protein